MKKMTSERLELVCSYAEEVKAACLSTAGSAEEKMRGRRRIQGF